MSLSAERLDALWTIGSRNRELEQVLQTALGIEPLVAAALIERGVDSPEAAQRYLYPSLDDLYDPKLLPDFEPAMRRLLDARDRGETIFLHGDYDVDGVTSAALLYRFLTKIGCKVAVHVPHRMKEGYGIAHAKVEDAAQSGAKLFLTCDCGGSALEQIGRARELGMDVVVTDHHQIGAEWPQANAFVNPHRSDSKYPFADLCGVGVAFKLCQGIAEELGLPIASFQRAYLDLVALGTIADVMPLVDENRILVKHGLPCLSQTKKPGLRALIRVANLEDRAASGFEAFNVSHGLGPRLNAAGRIDDAALSLELLLANDDEAAYPIAQRLETLNMARRELQELATREAMDMAISSGQSNGPIVIVAGENWHPGIVGIVAGRLKDAFLRPTFALTLSEDGKFYKGSGRSIPNFNLAEAIQANSDLFEGGGHAKAAGIAFRMEDLEAAQQRLSDYASARLTPEDYRQVVEVTAEADLDEISLTTAEQLALLEPFGEGARRPIFMSRQMRLESIRQTKNPDHPQPIFRRNATNTLMFKAFSMGSRLAEVSCPSSLDVAYEISVDDYRGRAVGYRMVDFVVSDA